MIPGGVREWLVSLYKIFVHFEAFMDASQSSLYCLPPLALPTIVQYYCTTIAQYMTPHDHALHMPYIHHKILTIEISCSGERDRLRVARTLGL